MGTIFKGPDLGNILFTSWVLCAAYVYWLTINDRICFQNKNWNSVIIFFFFRLLV